MGARATGTAGTQVTSRGVTATSSDLVGSSTAGPSTAAAPLHMSVTSAPAPSGQNTLDVTVVLPCYNEQDHVMQEVDRITAAMDASGYSYELLVIDDKSTDNTLQVLEGALATHPNVRLMPFRTNGGSGTARRIATREAF